MRRLCDVRRVGAEAINKANVMVKDDISEIGNAAMTWEESSNFWTSPFSFSLCYLPPSHRPFFERSFILHLQLPVALQQERYRTMLGTLTPTARRVLASSRPILTSSTRNFASSSTTFSQSDKPDPSSSHSTTLPSTTTSTPTSSPTPPSSSKPLVRESSSSPEDLNSRPLPYLSFPLGLPTPPSSSSPTWSETRDRLISPEHRMASRKAIVKEATRGYFHDFHAIKSHGGKTWRAPNTLIKDDRSLYFPRIEGNRLSDKKKANTVDILRGKVSIVALLGSKLSEEHTKSFYETTMNTFGTHPKFQLVMVSQPPHPPQPLLPIFGSNTNTVFLL